MDMQKIGSFLATLRKEKNLTQEQLGEKLGVTNKTVSRWENGNYLPPVEFLQMLGKLYGVSINELLSGVRLTEERYKESAEDYIVTDLTKKREDAKKRIAVAVVVSLITVVSVVFLIVLGAGFVTPVRLKIVTLAIAAVLMISGVGVCCVLSIDAGVYECPNCGNKFVPSTKDFIFGLHTFTKRKLKCPECGKKEYCKHRLS